MRPKRPGPTRNIQQQLKTIHGEDNVKSRKQQTATYRCAEAGSGAEIWKPTEPASTAEAAKPRRTAQESAAGTTKTQSREAKAGLGIRSGGSIGIEPSS